MGANTKTVTDASFDADVLGSDKPVLVDFWAEWCGPCKMVAPVLEEIAAEHADRITIAKVNIDENPEIARRYQIMSIPTMSVFSRRGREEIVGAKPKAALLKDLAELSVSGSSQPLKVKPSSQGLKSKPSSQNLRIAGRGKGRISRGAPSEGRKEIPPGPGFLFSDL